MGTVWSATDTTLGREVALKVLPEAVADDDERRLWFAREARVLAALNHPKIATLRGLERVDEGHVLPWQGDRGSMTRRRSATVATAVAGLLVAACCVAVSAAWVDRAEVADVEHLFRLSSRAYKSSECLEIIMVASVEIPPASPGERIVRYLLGSGREAVLDIGSLMTVVVNDDSVTAERPGLPGRVLQLRLEGDDLGSALASVRGESSLAGLWEPPQAALRAGKDVAEVIEAFRYSRILGELSVAGFRREADSGYEVRMEAANGVCIARFDPKSFLLVEIEYTVAPADAPAGYSMRMTGRFTTREIARSDSLFTVDPGDRLVVRSMRALSAEPPGIGRPPESILDPTALSDILLDLEALVSSLRDASVILVGEDHLYVEPPAFTTRLLDGLADRQISLLIELPQGAQPDIDEYLRTGREDVLARIFDGQPVLQVQDLLRWAHKHRDRVPTVEAFDEPLYEVRLRRAYLIDSRNATMARAIHRQWSRYPERRIVAYAGQLHMLRAGRYRVDQPSRESAGSRLPQLGVPPEAISAVMLNGGENFPLHSVWSETGALPIDGEPVRIPVAYLVDYPIFGVEFADEAFDYFVNLGPLTSIEVDIDRAPRNRIREYEEGQGPGQDPRAVGSPK
jgi:hypothetical protein